jgi:tRNA(Ile)-lysidine synthase
MADPAAQVRRAVAASLRAAQVARDDVVLAAVSGGPDSLALAAGLAAEAESLAVRGGAVVVDHGLQAGSSDQAATAAGQCRELGLAPVVVRRVEVGRQGGPEAAARTARHAAFEAVADEVGAVAVLLGHTLDDQAETVLLGLARGSGARSLAGMPAARGRLLRPLLGLPRATTVGACEALGLRPWHDPHNDDPAFARVRVRRGALPALEAAVGPGIAAALARTADLLRADADALDDLARAALAEPDALRIPALEALPAAVRSRVIRLAAIAAGVPAGSLSAAHVGEVERLVTDWHGQGAVRLPGGLDASRACDRLLIR